jgi:hypothetical protein
MNSKTLLIRELSRSPHQGREDKLTLEPGVNVIVGPHNSGKSKWFRMLDYLLGNENKPEEVFGEDLVEKYNSTRGVFEIGGEELVVERRWNEPGVRTKAFINGESTAIRELWGLLMERLEIPTINYPQGDPYSPRAWPELNWRSLFRHVYRRQAFWGDFADQQPASEQHACLLQFLGIATDLFSEKYRNLVSHEKKIRDLQIAKDQFVAMLQEVSKEIIDEQELGIALTPQSIETAVQRIQSEIDARRSQREITISSMLDSVTKDRTGEGTQINRDKVERLGEDLASLYVEQETIISSIEKTEARLEEIKNYRGLIAEERSRMERALHSGYALAELKITHCPSCDREIQATEDDSRCRLCRRPFSEETESGNSSAHRLDFELEQLSGELEETDDLLERLVKDVKRLSDDRAQVSNRISRIKELLEPTRTALSVILPPDIGISDVEIGRLLERLQQLERIKTTLDRREKIADQINEIQQLVNALELEIAEQSKKVDFERAGDLLSDGMNTYLNMIKSINPRSWTQEEVSFRLGKNDFSVKVRTGNWKTKLGGTLTLYFLIAYHYALISLTPLPDCNYPGLVLLDFPAELEDASSVADKENFVIEPFVSLLARPDMAFTQLLAAGSSFENLEGAHRIEFRKIWK